MNAPLVVGGVFSGIGGFTLAAHQCGMRVAWECEINPFARRVLKARFPGVTVYDDVREVDPLRLERIDVLCGGFPCQDLSVAGKRAGLSGERSGLFWEIVRLAEVLQPTWLVLENVPGLLSSESGRDMGLVVGALRDLGYLGAWRVLDAQWFGLAQRRRRVFLVCCLGEQRLAAVLPFLASGNGHPAPVRKAWEDPAGTLDAGTGRRRGAGQSPGSLIAPALSRSNPYGDHESREGLLVARTLTSNGFDASEDGTGRGTPIIAFNWQGGETDQSLPSVDRTHTLTANTVQAVAYGLGSHSGAADADVSNRSHANGGPSGMGISEELAHSLRAGRTQGVAMIPFDTTQITSAANRSNPQAGNPCHPLAAGAHAPAIAFAVRGREDGAQAECAEDGLAGARRPPGGGSSHQFVATAWDNDLNASVEQAGTLLRGGAGGRHEGVSTASSVRRLSPTECERLQGFSHQENGDWQDGHTCLCGLNRGRSVAPAGEAPCKCADGPRYQALGNAVAVPCVKWILDRVKDAEAQVRAMKGEG